MGGEEGVLFYGFVAAYGAVKYFLVVELKKTLL
jgi:hypothetical protein